MGGPLEGVRILDMTTVLMGPYASQVLGDMGAEVIKVESPQGDLVRGLGPLRHPGMGALFLHINRSKRSVVIDAKQPRGREALLRLAARSDVLLYNVRPRAMARLGLDYETVSGVNPRIIYLGTFGFGQGGPYAAKPAFDDLIQGAIGLPSLIKASGSDVPRYVPSNIVDRTVGLYAVAALCGALYHRERTGRGQRIDVPMFETMVSHLLSDHIAGETFDPPEGPTGYARLLAANRRPYRTRDGYVCAVIYNDKQWASFFRIIGRPEAMSDPRLADLDTRTRNIDDLQAMVGKIFLERGTEEWLALLEEADIPCMPLHDMDSILEDPHLREVGFFQWEDHPSEGRVRSVGVPASWSDSQPRPGRPAPRFGEHSAEVLAEAGYDADEIAAMARDGITHLAEAPQEAE
ncbi:CoA transferase [Allopusillimonas soli]|uniref:CoA transferase n=1 Tax=Allopusillimonas soli TaxID=659016 RepID=A0A853FAS1_9BURK|nr:CoA transferase [Allopusillimonas soli]NYT37824.1 CoA transferase [Allopusillimonas soli]TEA73731.1 CoA transferase [Allopusillimonas soli]